MSLSDQAIHAAGGARSSAIARLREVLEAARLYPTRRAAYERGQVRELALSTLDLERLSSALAGELPVVVHVSRASDILRRARSPIGCNPPRAWPGSRGGVSSIISSEATRSTIGARIAARP